MATIARSAPAARPLPREDLAQVLVSAGPVWPALSGARIFVTGGTGFFGRWLVESALFAADELSIRLEMVLLTRDPRRFAASAPHIVADRRIRSHEGDVRSFAFPDGAFTHVIHAGADADLREGRRSRPLALSSIVDGTRRVLDLAADRKAYATLFTSSGAIYGRQPEDVTHIPEDLPEILDPGDLGSAYGAGKRAAEEACAEYALRSGIAIKIARCFTFVGPHLPLEGFAVGNFIRDGLRGGPIEVQGDGTPYRSYLYAADLSAWLWSILVSGAAMRPYNVGSEEAVTIADIARLVGRLTETEVRIGGTRQPGASAERYVPSTLRARDELGLKQSIGLEDAVLRTLRWYGPTA